MSTESDSQVEYDHLAELRERKKQFLAEKEEQLKRIDEEILEAERDKKLAIRPGPEQ